MSVPANAKARLEYYEGHIAPFTTNAVAIGTTAPQVADLATKTEAARDALTAKLDAEQAAKAATGAWHTANNAMSLAGSAILDQVKAKAKIAGPTVWDLAQVDPPAPPTPVGELGMPENVVVTLDQTGAVTLKWKCTQPKAAVGTFYTVWRKLPAGQWECLGGCGSEKKFVDATMPAGTPSVTYKVQATRSGSTGPWAQFVVNFGVEMGEAMIASVVQVPAAKIAA